MMNESDAEFEKLIVPCQWEDKDADLIVQYKIDKKLNLESVSELSQVSKTLQNPERGSV